MPTIFYRLESMDRPCWSDGKPEEASEGASRHLEWLNLCGRRNEEIKPSRIQSEFAADFRSNADGTECLTGRSARRFDTTFFKQCTEPITHASPRRLVCSNAARDATDLASARTGRT